MKTSSHVLIVSLLCSGILNSACSEFLNTKHHHNPAAPTPQPTPVEEPKFLVAQATSWMELCERRAELPEAPRATIESMLIAGETCEALDTFAHPDISTEHRLIIQNTTSTDLSPIAFLPYARRLSIYSTELTELSGLKVMKNLERLDIVATPIVDFSALAELPKLTELSALSNKLTDLTTFGLLSQLEILSLNGTGVEDLRPLAGLAKLQKFDIMNTIVDDPYCPKNSASPGLNAACKFMQIPCDPNNFKPYFVVSKEERARMPSDKVIRQNSTMSPFTSFFVMKPQTSCQAGLLSEHYGEGYGDLPIRGITNDLWQDGIPSHTFKLVGPAGERIIGTDRVCVVEGKEVCHLFLEAATDPKVFTVVLKDLDGNELLREVANLKERLGLPGRVTLFQGEPFYRE